MAKKTYTPESFESANKYKYTRMFNDMLTSEVFLSLSKNQRTLYLYMKMQYNGKENPKYIGESNKSFYFNKHLWKDKYKLYTNTRQFQRDRDELIKKGFIICEYKGSIQRKKDIYSFSDKWKKYGTDMFSLTNNEKTTSMLHNEQRGSNEKK